MGDYGQLHQTEVLLKVLDKVHRNYSEVGVIVNFYITFVLVMLSITFLKIKDYLLHWWRAVFWTRLIVGLVSLGEWIWDWLWEVHLCTSFPLSPPSIREFRASQWGPENSGMATELPLPVNSLCTDEGPTFMENYFLLVGYVQCFGVALILQ